MKTRERLQSANARWDTESCPGNAGWVVDVVRMDGSKDTFPAAPTVYYEPLDGDRMKVLAHTLLWEGMELKP